MLLILIFKILYTFYKRIRNLNIFTRTRIRYIISAPYIILLYKSTCKTCVGKSYYIIGSDIFIFFSRFHSGKHFHRLDVFHIIMFLFAAIRRRLTIRIFLLSEYENNNNIIYYTKVFTLLW